MLTLRSSTINGNARIHRLLHGRDHRVGLNGADNQDVHVTGEQVVHVGGLLRGLVFAVGRDDLGLGPVLLRPIHVAVDHSDAPRVVHRALREADDGVVVRLVNGMTTFRGRSDGRRGRDLRPAR